MSQIPVELCELVDADGRPVGKVIPRGSERAPGEYFPVVHLWIVDEGGQFLIQRRADHLASQPGIWATTAGYVQAGETILEAAVREAREEMGLVLGTASIQSLGYWLAEHRHQAVLLLRTRRESLGAVEIGEEVSDFRWEQIEAITAMVRSGEFHRYGYLEQLIIPLTRASTTAPG